ncbi:MAG TPA: DUF2194 domain-containing protein [Anaerolineales bacterium]|nr:DUF2194 domain-containing protein [Anaerolineales bacterium]
MKYHHSFSLLLLPLLILVALASLMLVVQSGVRYEIGYPPMRMLPPEKIDIKGYFGDRPVETLVMYDSDAFAGAEHVKTVLSVLDNMQVSYDVFDVSSGGEYDLAKYENVVVSFINLEKYEAHISDLVSWVEQGGHLLFSIRPDPSRTFNAIYRKLGIVSKSDGLIIARGVDFISDLMPGTKGLKVGADFIASNSYFVELEPECKVYLKSLDEFHDPVLWECAYQHGRFVVLNSDQFNTKSDRGIIAAAYSLVQDITIYPVINGSIYFINEFPSPIKQGTDDFIAQQFGRDIQNFYINVWWPDVQQLSHRYGIKYTVAFLETFNDTVFPPFNKQLENEKYQYFGGLVLNNNGEIGMNGYNHVPLCLSEAEVNQKLDYPAWVSLEAMELSLYESYSFTKATFPDNKITTYIPPSNILCPESRRWLPQVLPDLKVISSLYLPGEGGLAYEQEFSEAPDGIIELPRVAGGYELSSYLRWASINELGFHYINSYYISPDDVLSDAQGSQKGWSYLHSQFEEYVRWLSESAPGLRNLTASEGAMAVQRFARLAVKTEKQEGQVEISLGNFYDEAWLMLRSSQPPRSIDGGIVTQVSSNLYLIRALKPHIVIRFME